MMIQVMENVIQSNWLTAKLTFGTVLTGTAPWLFENIETWTETMKLISTALALVAGIAICVRSINEARKSLKDKGDE